MPSLCRHQSFILATFLALFTAGLASATVPTTMPYQGFLTDGSGDPISGTVNLHFSLYTQDTGGTPVWQEQHASVAVTAGFFRLNSATRHSWLISFRGTALPGYRRGWRPGDDAAHARRQRPLRACFRCSGLQRR